VGHRQGTGHFLSGAALLAALLLASPAFAGSIAVSGAVAKPLALSFDALRAMQAVTVAVSQQTDKGPSSGSFTGVLLWTLIQTAAPIDAPGKNAQLRHTFLVAGDDGYAAALSQGEINPKLEGKSVILAWSKDGQPLAAPELVVPGDAHAARRVHDVTRIVIQ
jgi:DMSO/TMAO reductase YedYZ molybdopterin-dependent catalytic subunit